MFSLWTSSSLLPWTEASWWLEFVAFVSPDRKSVHVLMWLLHNVAGEQASEGGGRFASKSILLIPAKVQVQMWPYCLLRSASLHGSLVLAFHHVGYHLILKK